MSDDHHMQDGLTANGAAADSLSAGSAAAASSATAAAVPAAAAAAASAPAVAPAANGAPLAAAHVGAILPRLEAQTLRRADGGPVNDELAAAHASLLQGLDEIDSTVAHPAPNHAKRIAGLYQQLLQEYLESLVVEQGRLYRAPGASNLQTYWSELLCSIVTHRWWPQMVARLLEQGPPESGMLLTEDEIGALSVCARVMPQQLNGRLISRAVMSVSMMPGTVIRALNNVRVLTAGLLQEAANAPSADDAASLAKERELLQLSVDSLRTLLSTPVAAITEPVRDVAVLPNQMLDAAEALVLACVQSRSVRAEPLLGPIHTALSSLVGPDGAIANHMLATSTNPVTWSRWVLVAARLKNPAFQPVNLPTPAPQPTQQQPQQQQQQNGAPAPTKGRQPRKGREAAADERNTSKLADAEARHAAASAAAGNSAAGHLPAAFVANLTSELLSWVNARTLSYHELSQRDVLLEQLEKLVRRLDPALRADVFGSAASRTAMKGSDMDVALFTASGKVAQISKNFLTKLTRAIRQEGRYIEVQPILHARVPIIKFTERRSGIAVDLSVGQVSTPYKSRLLRAYTDYDSRVSQLIAVVKHWANSHDLNDASQGTLNSFGWSLLVIQYLQLLQPPLLPSLQQQSDAIRAEESRAGLVDKLAPADPQEKVAGVVASAAVADGAAPAEPQSPFVLRVDLRDSALARFYSSTAEEITFVRDAPAAAASASSPQLGALFVGFLHFYAHVFDAAAHVVNIRAGGLCPRSHWTGPHKFTTGGAAGLCIVDPFDMSDNVARAIKPQTWSLIRMEMGTAIRQLQAKKSFAYITNDRTAPQDLQEQFPRMHAQPQPQAHSNNHAQQQPQAQAASAPQWRAKQAPPQQQQHLYQPPGFYPAQQAAPQPAQPHRPPIRASVPPPVPMPSASVHAGQQPQRHYPAAPVPMEASAAAAAAAAPQSARAPAPVVERVRVKKVPQHAHSAAGQPPLPVPRQPMPPQSEPPQ